MHELFFYFCHSYSSLLLSNSALQYGHTNESEGIVLSQFGHGSNFFSCSISFFKHSMSTQICVILALLPSSSSISRFHALNCSFSIIITYFFCLIISSLFSIPILLQSKRLKSFSPH